MRGSPVTRPSLPWAVPEPPPLFPSLQTSVTKRPPDPASWITALSLILLLHHCLISIHYYPIYFFHYSWHSILFSISFRYTAHWWDIYIIEGVVPNQVSARLAPHITITVSSTMFPRLYFTPSWLCCQCHLYFSLLSPFAPSSRPRFFFSFECQFHGSRNLCSPLHPQHLKQCLVLQ